MLSAIFFNLDQSKILSTGNGLTLPHNKKVEFSKIRAFADNNLDVIEVMECLYNRIENMGKGENAGY